MLCEEHFWLAQNRFTCRRNNYHSYRSTHKKINVNWSTHMSVTANSLTRNIRVSETKKKQSCNLLGLGSQKCMCFTGKISSKTQLQEKGLLGLCIHLWKSTQTRLILQSIFLLSIVPTFFGGLSKGAVGA